MRASCDMVILILGQSCSATTILTVWTVVMRICAARAMIPTGLRPATRRSARCSTGTGFLRTPVYNYTYGTSQWRSLLNETVFFSITKIPTNYPDVKKFC
jgi:hypothetical protein